MSYPLVFRPAALLLALFVLAATVAASAPLPLRSAFRNSGPGPVRGIPGRALSVSTNFRISAGVSNATAASNLNDFGGYTGLAFANGVLHPA